MSKYLLVQTAIGDYRQKVLSLVDHKLYPNFKILCGHEYFDKSVKTGVILNDTLSFVDNYFLFNRKLLFQSGVFLHSLTAKNVILELNPRIISVWLILLGRRLFFKKCVLWGHAWPRGGQSSKSDGLRNVMRSLASLVVVYTDSQKKELEAKMPNKKIISAPNALYESADMWVPKSERTEFIYVGRLVKNKKPDLMIKAYAKAKRDVPSIGNLIIVGSGPEELRCKELAAKLSVAGHVLFHGHVSDIDRLRDLYSRSVASISPGYVGLSITQSFSFGTPMVVADNEPHAPEIEAAVPGQNCRFFKADSEVELANRMIEFWREREDWKSKEAQILEDCKNRYSVEVMASRLLGAFQDE